MIGCLHRGGLAAALVGLLALGTPAARAGEKEFTARDAARQAAFITAMDSAANAAKRGDRAGAQAGLRRALEATGGGVNVNVLPGASACGQPAFEVPSWLLSAQAEIGDIAGAKRDGATPLVRECNAARALPDRADADQKGKGERALSFRRGRPQKGSAFAL